MQPVVIQFLLEGGFNINIPKSRVHVFEIVVFFFFPDLVDKPPGISSSSDTRWKKEKHNYVKKSELSL